MQEESLLVRTRQVWRLFLGLLWLPLAGLGMVAATLRGLLGRTPEQEAGFIISGLTIGVAGMAWAALTVRCPGCGARLLWKSMRERTPSDWLSWLVRLAMCPVCGCDGADKDRVSRQPKA